MPESIESRPNRSRVRRQHIGKAHEDLALRWLVARGLTPLERNRRTPFGEIDLILRHGSDMVFVEVRARRSSRFGGAAASVGAAKQRRIVASAAWLLPELAQRHWRGVTPACRYDVVAFEAGRAHWLQAAFDGSADATMR